MLNISRYVITYPVKDENLVSSSEASVHFPVIATYLREFIPVENDEDLKGNTLFIYFKPLIKSSSRLINNTSKKLIEALNERGEIVRFPIKEDFVYVAQGYILTSDKIPLLTLALKDKYYYAYYTEQDYSKFVLYLSTDLVSNPKYASFYRRLSVAYLSDCYSKGVEVRIVAPQVIENNTFASDFEIRPSSISQLQSYLETEVGQFFVNRDEDFKLKSPSLIPEEEIQAVEVPPSQLGSSIIMDLTQIPGGSAFDIDRWNNYLNQVGIQPVAWDDPEGRRPDIWARRDAIERREREVLTEALDSVSLGNVVSQGLSIQGQISDYLQHYDYPETSLVASYDPATESSGYITIRNGENSILATYPDRTIPEPTLPSILLVDEEDVSDSLDDLTSFLG